MPSKSKAQARFFAAAAHNPDFAKKAGMSTKTAKEWNKADEKEGTLKKGSKKPEHVKEEVLDEEILDEASGVGLFPVPPSSMALIQKYASSVLLTYAYKSFQNMQQNTDDSLDQMAANKILPFLKRFQQKYGAQVLNDASMKRYVNQSIKMPLDHEAIFRELPKSLQNDKVKELIANMKVFITLDANYGGGAGGHAKKINDSTSEIVLALSPNRYTFSVNAGTDGLEDTMKSMQYFMGSIDHEMQHAFQQIVTAQVNRARDKNLEMKSSYSDMEDAYHASGIEFGPQTKDMISAANLWLDTRNDAGELSGNTNRDIKDAIQHAFKRLAHGQGKVYQALKKYKEDANAKKHMTLIYKGIAKHYSEMNNDEDHELDLDVKDVDGGEDRLYHSNTKGPDENADQNDPMVQIYNAMKKRRHTPYHVEEDRSGGYGEMGDNPYNKLGSMTYKLGDGAIVRFLNMKNRINITTYADGKNPSRAGEDTFAEITLPMDKLDLILKHISGFDNFKSINGVISDINDDMNTVQMTIDEIGDQFAQWYENAKMYAEELPNKKLKFEVNEGTLFFRLEGARDSWYIQESSKGYCVLEDNETYERKGLISYKDLEDVMTYLFTIYLSATDRQFNRVMKNLNEQEITVQSLDRIWDYVQETSKQAVGESSMRGFMDLVQDAEIADGIDQANKSTDVSRLAQKKKDSRTNSLNQLGETEDEEFDLQGKPVKPGQQSADVHAGTSTERGVKLEEMPQRFDAFANQDRDEFVDKSAEMTGKHNMVPFTQHEQFDVMRIKNGSGFIAYDKQGKQLALLSGYSGSNIVRGVGPVFVENAVAAKSTVKGVVYQMYMDILDAGYSILSDGLHSDDAIKFWTRLLSNHKVYVVADDEVLARATPEKVHKYWNEDEFSPSAELRLLLVK